MRSGKCGGSRDEMTTKIPVFIEPCAMTAG